MITHNFIIKFCDFFLKKKWKFYFYFCNHMNISILR